jgi:hypothetical protein
MAYNPSEARQISHRNTERRTTNDSQNDLLKQQHTPNKTVLLKKTGEKRLEKWDWNGKINPCLTVTLTQIL